MGKDAAGRAEIRAIIDAALRGVLTQAQADRANDLGRDATNAVMLAASGRIAELCGKIGVGGIGLVAPTELSPCHRPLL